MVDFKITTTFGDPGKHHIHIIWLYGLYKYYDYHDDIHDMLHEYFRFRVLRNLDNEKFTYTHEEMD